MDKDKPTCSVAECNKSVKARGYCTSHYLKFVRNPNLPQCSRVDCGKRSAAKGLCSVHYAEHLAESAARGYCTMHYGRHQRHGGATFSLIGSQSDQLKFLESLAEMEADGCIEWPFGMNSNGYGEAIVGGKRTTAHRAALTISSGPPPSSLHVAAHGSCHNTACVNPLHLSWKTASENANDRWRDGTMVYGEDANATKLSQEDVQSICLDERSGSVIASQYGVTRGAIYAIKTGETWSWLTGIKRL